MCQVIVRVPQSGRRPRDGDSLMVKEGNPSSGNPSSPPRSVSSAFASAASPKRDQSCVETSSGRPSASSSLMTRADAADWRCSTSHNRFTRAARWNHAVDHWAGRRGEQSSSTRPPPAGTRTRAASRSPCETGGEREQTRRARERDRTTITAMHTYTGVVRETLHKPPPCTRPADVRARWSTTHVRDSRTDARAIRFDGPLPV